MFSSFAAWLVTDILSLSGWGADALQFFLADTIWILLLLLVITHFMSLLRWYLPVDRVRHLLVSRRWYGADYFLATLFGAVTPFCSCSSTPMFIGFVQARVPLGVTFSFLITSPLINEVALALFWGLFGWKVTLFYLLAGIVIGMVGGMILSRFPLEGWLEPFVQKLRASAENASQNTKKLPLSHIWKKVSAEARSIWKNLALYVLIGVAIGAVVHGYVPEGFFAERLQGAGWWSVPLATILAVPLYINAAGAIPVVESFVAKGVPLGTGLAFMMAVVGLSLPEAFILRRVMRPKLLGLFFSLVTLGIILIGWGFTAILS